MTMLGDDFGLFIFLPYADQQRVWQDVPLRDVNIQLEGNPADTDAVLGVLKDVMEPASVFEWIPDDFDAARVRGLDGMLIYVTTRIGAISDDRLVARADTLLATALLAVERNAMRWSARWIVLPDDDEE